MKSPLITLSLLLMSFPGGFAVAGSSLEAEPCSLAVGVTTMLGGYRTWTNPLETGILQRKGLAVCQDEAILELSDSEMRELTEEEAQNLLRCKTEFRLELLFHKDQTTRNVTIFKSKRVVFSQNYPPIPRTLGSLKILRTIPTCAELQDLAKKSEN